MSTLQVQDKIFQQCQFLITPIQAKRSQNIRNCHGNSFLIKLGTESIKAQNLGEVIEFNLNIAYSKALMKYYPIKGIIKVYDKCEGGIQMILGVGGFQTDDLLNQGLSHSIIQKEIGSIKLIFDVKINKKSVQRMFKKDKINNQLPQLPNNIIRINTTQGINSIYVDDGNDSPIQDLNQDKDKIKQTISPQKNVISQSMVSMTQSQFNTDIQKKQAQILGQQLIAQRRNVQLCQQKLLKATLKNNLFKKKIGDYQKQIKIFIQNFSNILQNIQTEQNGSYTLQINQKSQYLKIFYKSNNFSKIFVQFLQFLTTKVQEHSNTLLYNSNFETDQNIIVQRIQQLQQEKIQLKKDIENKDKQILELKKQTKKIQSSPSNVQRRLNAQMKHIIQLEDRIKQLTQQNNKLQQNSKYFKDKDNQAQALLFAKDNTIQHLGKLLSNQNCQLERLHAQVKNKTKIIQNSQLTIQQNKQQLSNLSQIIQQYRNRYGQLRNMKKRQLENQIKQNIRWANSLNRDPQWNQFQDTMQSDLNHTDTFSQVIRSIQIENLPIEQINGIRSQLLKILIKVDSLLKNTSRQIDFE